MKIVVLDGFTLNPGDLSWHDLEQQGEVRVFDRTSEDLVQQRSEGTEIILTNKTILSSKTIEALPSLRYIGVLATGFNIVDIAAAQKADVMVTNVPGYGSASVAQHAFALILEFADQVGLNNESVRSGDWVTSPDWSYSKKQQFELSGKTLGIVGLGQIGGKVASIASGFGMRVIYHNPMPKKDTAHVFKDLSHLFSESDIVTLHCPLTEANEGFVDAALISKMKPSAFLINTSRGPLIHEKDLAGALNEGLIAGAGLDVLSTEPPASDNPLLTAKNCFITPHNAWASKEARGRLLHSAVENVQGFFGGHPQNVVS